MISHARGSAIVGGMIAAFVLDRITKYLALHSLDESIELIPRTLSLTYTPNTHLLFYFDLPTAVLFGIIAVVIALLLWMLGSAVAQERIAEAACLLLVFVGAVSNILDRLWYGAVIDFINVPVWSVFNLSDIYIVVGIVAYIGVLQRAKRTLAEKKAQG